MAVGALLVAACLGSDFADSIEGSWELSSGTFETAPIPLVPSHPITITFEDDQVTGTASCNGYGGTFELNGSDIAFGDLAMTEMACSPEEAMTAETMYAQALTMVDTVAVDEGLTLTGENVELVFTLLEPVPDAELTNVVWVLDGLIAGDAISTPVASSRATVEFFSDGSVLGDTGCRPLSGNYVVNGAEVQMTELAADGNECEPEMVDQDSHFISVIEGGFRVEIEGDRLTIVAQGNEGLSFVREG